MKALRLLTLLAALGTAGCDMAAQQRVDQQTVAQSGVSSAVYEKMVRGAPLSLDDVIALTRAGVRDSVIKRYIDYHDTIYHLTRADADRLRHGGVSFDLITFMEGTVTGHWPYPKAGHFLTPFGRGV